jgi:hypothetical protein
MKTVLVVYSNRKMTAKEIGYTKRYAFNTDADVKEGAGIADLDRNFSQTLHFLVISLGIFHRNMRIVLGLKPNTIVLTSGQKQQ